MKKRLAALLSKFRRQKPATPLATPVPKFEYGGRRLIPYNYTNYVDFHRALRPGEFPYIRVASPDTFIFVPTHAAFIQLRARLQHDEFHSFEFFAFDTTAHRLHQQGRVHQAS